MSYRMHNKSLACESPGASCPDIVMPIVGFAPAEGTGHPVYMHTSGGGRWFSTQTRFYPEERMLQEMASRGFVAAMVEYPVVPAEHLICSSSNATTFLTYARMMYGRQPGSTSALATLCGHESADCSAGIALLGHSLGGLIATMAPRVTKGITATLLWGAGSRMAYGYSCCGVFSGDSSCCIGGQPVGGTSIPCMAYADTSPFLDKSRRRLLIYSGDHEYGDCYYRGSDSPQVGDGSSFACNAPSSSNPAGSLIISKRDSGYDCGESLNCLQADGSGYYIPSLAQVGPNSSGPKPPNGNGHNFHNDWDDGETPNANWITTTDAWGLIPSCDWLAATAVRPAA